MRIWTKIHTCAGSDAPEDSHLHWARLRYGTNSTGSTVAAAVGSEVLASVPRVLGETLSDDRLPAFPSAINLVRVLAL